MCPKHLLSSGSTLKPPLRTTQKSQRSKVEFVDAYSYLRFVQNLYMSRTNEETNASSDNDFPGTTERQMHWSAQISDVKVQHKQSSYQNCANRKRLRPAGCSRHRNPDTAPTLSTGTIERSS